MQVHSQPDEGYSEDPLNPSPVSLLGPSSAIVGHDAIELSAPHDLATWITKNLPYLPVSVKSQLAIALLDGLPSPTIAQIAERLQSRLHIDFVRYLPPEICLKIFGYLDPASLLNVACCCRSWYSLAVDWKLWQRLYHLEGWRAVYPEIKAWEAKMNESVAARNSAVTTYSSASSESSRPSKRRAISEDEDAEMRDVHRPPTLDDSHAESSIFASPKPSSSSSSAAAATTTTTTTTARTRASQPTAMDVDGATTPHVPNEPPPEEGWKGKGKARAAEDASPRRDPTALANSNLPAASIWTWDALNSRYRLNWRYVYNLRRRLESNWEQAKFVNFQLPLPDHPEEGHQECIYTLQFDSQYLVSGSRDRTIRIWSMDTRRLLRPPLKGHTGSVLSLQFDADPEEDLIVSGSSDSNVIIWRFSTGEIVQRLTTAHSDSVLNVKFDKRIIVTCSKDKSIKIFNRRPLRHGEVGYNPDADPVNPVPIQIRDYRHGSPTDHLPIIPPYSMIGRLEGHSAAVNAVQIHDNEVVSASGDRNIKVWDWPQQVCSRTVVGHGKGIACVQYDGRRIVSGSSDNEIKVFDSTTGIEVASLKGHSHLVRTVQAGFGDLPYSEHEDRLVAKKLDKQYLKALESGALSAGNFSRGRLAMNSIAGGGRLENINAYGAVLPPGGGGGRYARIVSGSYDQRIIIWRRDEDDRWVPAHRLHHQRAIDAAQNRRPAPTPSPSAGGQQGSATAPGSSQRSTTIETPIIATITPDSAASFRALIDLIVPQGVLALQQALASYPTMLAYHGHLQAAINREPLPNVRGQLRQVVANAIVATQQAQARARLASMQHTNGPIRPPTLPPLSTIAGPSTSTMGAASIGAAPGPSTAYSPARPADRPSGTPTPVAVAAGTSGTGGAQDASLVPGSAYRGPTVAAPQVQGHIHIQGQGVTSPGQYQQQQVPPAPVQSHSTPVPLAQAATPPPPPSQGPAPQQAHGQTQPQAHHAPQHQAAHGGPGAHQPPPANAESPAVRVFKLQFDARRIICCSQTNVIVGWDFCNGDGELEAVSRIFDTII